MPCQLTPDHLDLPTTALRMEAEARVLWLAQPRPLVAASHSQHPVAPQAFLPGHL